MNSPFESHPELESLIHGYLEETLSESEERTLAGILSNSEEARTALIQACELNAMLESERSVQSAMTKDLLPGNVLTLGDAATLTPVTEAPPARTGKKLMWSAAAAAVGLLAAFGPWKEKEAPDAITPPLLAEEKAKPAVTRELEKVDPETQYERAVLATLGSGSQQRPPTNFSVEPSLADEEISYNRHIRPILSDNCFSCHGPDEHGRKADLRLDTFEGATDHELKTIVPGKPDESQLITRILSKDDDDIMPPPESHKTLTAAQITLLTRWVEGGAEYEEHWSFIPIEKPIAAEGEVNIDRLIEKDLNRLGLEMSPEAEPEILVRRLYLDLTGLPPSPEEIEVFVKSRDPEAYTALVDDLLSRPSYGEHRARYWLDAARYADTHGLHLDNYREMWPYRDWVIEAFNDNMPFDQFTIEQIAGDLLPNATREQQIATGFNRCNVTTSEGGAIEEEFLVRYAVDRVATTSTVWMGLTAGCAQCHDHKFDPITMKDFYSLFAFFNNTTQPGMDENRKDSPPVIRIYASHDEEERAGTLRKQIAAKQKEANEHLAAADTAGLSIDEVRPDLAFSASGAIRNQEAGRFSKSEPFTISFRYDLPDTESQVPLLSRIDPEHSNRGWRIYWKDRSIAVELIESFPNKRLKTAMTRRVRSGSSGHFAVVYDGSGSSEGIRLYLNGTLISSRFQNSWLDTMTGDFSLEDIPVITGGKIEGTGETASLSELFITDRLLLDREIELASKLPALIKAEKAEAAKLPTSAKEGDPQNIKPEMDKDLHEYLAANSGSAYREDLIELAELRTQLLQIESVSPTTLVMAEKDASMPKANLLLRGEYDQKADEVDAAFPAFLPTLDDSLPKNRLGLAKWLVHPDHPLTARVAVNRIWQEMFGMGLVKTSEDFGTQGENPSHPQLLDFLAASFIESGWDVKQLYRRIVLSRTYRQSSVISTEMSQRDPENRLLSRGPRFRLDAEVIRDQALHVSGLLDGTPGGKGVRPYQPSGIWETVGYSNSNTQTFHQDFGPRAESRRSIYTFWKRTAHSPTLAIFDAPNREICIMRRERTNTPLQALVMMNDPQFVRAARHLAKRVIKEAESRDERFDRFAVLLRGHPFTAEERQVVTNSFDQFRNIYESDEEGAAQLLVDESNPAFSISADTVDSVPEFAAYTMVANQLLNLDESLNKN
ncbi:MAG: DUF1553 domain-containing protein [Verrucomicrobiales bacterium]|nr:DUF1553 domain-containing protein [Verrucomicrobiales bacterium]